MIYTNSPIHCCYASDAALGKLIRTNRRDTDSNMIILGKDGTQVCEHFGQLSAPFLPAADAPPASALDGVCSPTVVPEMCMPCPLEGLRTV